MSKNRKVLIALNSSWNLFNFRASLIRALNAAGFEVVVVAPPDEYSVRLSALGCRYIPLPIHSRGTSAYRDLLLLYRFWRLLKREQPALYMGYTIKPNTYGSLAARALGIPVINTITGLGTVFIHGGLLQRMAQTLYRHSLSRSLRVLFQNDEDRQLFINQGLVRKEQTRILPGSGVDLVRFVPQQKVKQLRSLCFLLTGRILWDKGIGEFVEAARQVRNQFPDTRFQLLGFTGSDNQSAISGAQLQRWVDEGVVEYLGATDDVRPHLAAADCVVLPSYREGAPRSLLEAAAMAKPIIATDVPGCREVVVHHVNGLLCRPRSAADLAAKMIELIDMTAQARADMGQKGRERVEREFDEKKVIAAYLSELEAIPSLSAVHLRNKDLPACEPSSIL